MPMKPGPLPLTDQQDFIDWVNSQKGARPRGAPQLVDKGPIAPKDTAQAAGEFIPDLVAGAMPAPQGAPPAATPAPGDYRPSDKFGGQAPAAPQPAVGDRRYDSFADLEKDGGRGGVQMSDGGYVKMAPGGNSDVVRMKNDPGAMFQKYLAVATGNNPSMMYDPQVRKGTMDQYLGLVKEMGQGDRDQLEAQRVSNQREQFYRELGQRQDTHGLDQAKFGLEAKNKEWAMSPERRLEEAQMAAYQMKLKKVAETGKALDPRESEAINDLAKNSLVARPGTAPDGTPIVSDASTGGGGGGKKLSLDPMKDLLGDDPTLVADVNNAKDVRSKLGVIHARRGAGWVQQNWPAVEAALKSADPRAADTLKASATPGTFAKIFSSPGDLLGSIGSTMFGPGKSPGLGNTMQAVSNVPIGERLSRMNGTAGSEDQLNALIRYLYLKDGGMTDRKGLGIR